MYTKPIDTIMISKVSLDIKQTRAVEASRIDTQCALIFQAYLLKREEAHLSPSIIKAYQVSTI